MFCPQNSEIMSDKKEAKIQLKLHFNGEKIKFFGIYLLPVPPVIELNMTSRLIELYT